MGGEEALYHCCMGQQPEAEATKAGGQGSVNKEALGEGHYSIHSLAFPSHLLLQPSSYMVLKTLSF